MAVSETSTKRRISRRMSASIATLLVLVVVLAFWMMNTPSGLMGKADAIGYAVCHRIDLRSFHLGSRALPLCVRCTGMYLGAMLSLGYYALVRPRVGLYPSRALILALIFFGILWAIDGLNSYFHLFPAAPHLYTPSHVLRLTTGILIGVAMATLIFPMFNQTVWRTWRQEAVLRSATDLLRLLALAAILIILTLWENPLILYPLALVSSIGVLVVLALVYTLVMLTFFRHENRAQSWRDLAIPFLAGLAIAILQIALIDLGRFWLTGTWDGFQL